jgi:uncharacterized protein (TIGR00251 family)
MASTLLKLIVKPNARKFKYQWMSEDILKVEVPAPPEKNKANESVVQYLSELLNIPSQQIELKSGKASRHKHILIPLDIKQIKEVLR